MADWFIGSDSKALGTDTWVHTIGFRSEHALLALVVCDIDDVTGIDRQSIRAHINLHPIEAVDVVLLASGVTGSLPFAPQSADMRHTIVHRIVDCIIDALTFGCPALMRITPQALQWRKFDEHPIATLTRHTTPVSMQQRHALTHMCGDPTICTLSALPVADSDYVVDLQHAAAHPVTHVAWRQQADATTITINDTVVTVTLEPIPPTSAPTQWSICVIPTPPSGRHP